MLLPLEKSEYIFLCSEGVTAALIYFTISYFIEDLGYYNSRVT